MKLDVHETHDRLKYLVDQDFDIASCAQNLIDQRPFGAHPFYIFCHARTHEDGSSKRYIWSPWICKPRAQTNTILLKAYPNTDIVKWMWILPVREMWATYRKGTMFENEFIVWCTETFDLDKTILEAPEDDDPTTERMQEIVFEYHPQLFKRESLPEHLKGKWDYRMNERRKLKQESVADSSSSVLA